MTDKKLKYSVWVSYAVFVILLLPLLYLTGVNRATGDDYGYGMNTRLAWMATHSFIEVGKAVGRTVVQFWHSWQGTWFSIALFSLQPEVFSDKAYVIVAVLMLFLWCGSAFYLFREILCRKMGMNQWGYRLITVWFLIIAIEWIPSTRSAIFWFNGCAHYMVPFAMCQMVAAWLLRYCEEYHKGVFALIFLFMTLLGGSNYQAALLALIVACYVGVASWILQRDKRIFALCIPVAAELIGLIVSMIAPGNRNRAGENFGFSIARVVSTIGKSFWYGLKDMGTYWRERPLIFVGLLFLFLLCLLLYVSWENAFRFRHPIWLAAMLFCLYSAMQSPAIYADVNVSGGVPNTNLQVFLLCAGGGILILSDKVSAFLQKKWQDNTKRRVWKTIMIPGMIVCLVLTMIERSHVKTSASWVSLQYITSGQAADYREQMDLQTALLEDESKEDVVVPGINDVQGPLMHMPITEDPEAFTNRAASGFYGKKSVVMIERPRFVELYGE